MPNNVLDVLNLLLRWGHILPAIFLMGGAFFMRFALLPAMGELPEKEREELGDRVRGPWGIVVMTSIALLLLSGMINVALILSGNKLVGDGATTYYHSLLTVKVILAIAIFYIASMLTGRSEAAAEWRKHTAYWLNVNLTLAIILVMIAGAMRLVPREPKKPSTGDLQAIPVEAPLKPGTSP